MSDGLLPLNPATLPGGKIEDVEDLIGAAATPVIRQRLQVTGAVLAEVARVLNLDPQSTDYGLVVRPVVPTTSSAVPTKIDADVVVTTLLLANGNRRNATFYNAFGPGMNGNLYIKLGAGASLTDFNVMLFPGAYYTLEEPIYDGVITGIWDAVGGFVQVAELT